MISREHRFHGYNSLRHVYQNGTSARGPLFAVKCTPNQRRSSYRLAVVVSRKVEKSAVARNRIRRRLYENVQAVENDITQPFDIVLTVFDKAVLDEPAKSLAAQVKKQFISAGILAQPVQQ